LCFRFGFLFRLPASGFRLLAAGWLRLGSGAQPRAKVPDSVPRGKPRYSCGGFSLSRRAGRAEKTGMRAKHRQRVWIPWIATLGLACGAGCFVVDELDKGQAQLRKHSPDGGKVDRVEKDESGGISLAALREKSVGAIEDIQGRVEEALAPEPDPENVIIQCAIEGRSEFTRKFDCQSRGGRVIPR